MKVLGVIPARYQATRLPQKMLRLLGGAPLIEQVWKNAKQSRKLNELIVATDHQAIFDVVQKSGGKAVMTSPEHPSGTDRIAEAAAKIDCDIVINIQGDEPFLDPRAIDALVAAFEKENSFQVGTLCFPIREKSLYESPHVVKVVMDRNGYALYFSRATIPYYREAQDSEKSFFKHLGIYGYRKSFLSRFSQLPASSLEVAEKLEQLRILESGEKIKVVVSPCDSIGIDTEEDLKRAESLWQQKNRK